MSSTVEIFTAGKNNPYVTVSGTSFNDDRIAGPPSKLLPPLRDLCINPIVRLRNGEVAPVITVELDTKGGRTTGVIKGYSNTGGEHLWLTTERPSSLRRGESVTNRRTIKFENILAFRLLKVEVPDSAIG